MSVNSQQPNKERKQRVSKTAKAYHEAGHAVVALFFGHALNYRGKLVSIRRYFPERDGLGTRSNEGCVKIIWNAYVSGVFTQPIILLAGHIAQHKAVGETYPCEDDDIVDQAIIDCRDAGEFLTDDFNKIISITLNIHYATISTDILQKMRQTEAATKTILNRQDVWRSIERVASGLIERTSLDSESVINLLDDGVMSGASFLTNKFEKCLLKSPDIIS